MYYFQPSPTQLTHGYSQLPPRECATNGHNCSSRLAPIISPSWKQQMVLWDQSGFSGFLAVRTASLTGMTWLQREVRLKGSPGRQVLRYEAQAHAAISCALMNSFALISEQRSQRLSLLSFYSWHFKLLHDNVHDSQFATVRSRAAKLDLHPFEASYSIDRGSAMSANCVPVPTVIVRKQ